MKLQKKPFSCKRDGLTIRGHLLRRPGSEPLPAAILCHEFMENQHSMARYARTLAEAGFAAFIFDFCGGCIVGTSDGKSRNMTVLTELRDLFAVMDHVLSRADVCAQPLVLVGGSQGGFVIAMAAAQRPQDVARLALFYPALCIPDDARSGKLLTARIDPSNPKEIISRFPITLGKEYALSAQKLDAYSEVRGYHGPVLLIHGTVDHMVDVAYSRRAAVQYGDTCKYIEFRYADHIFHGVYAHRAAAYLREFTCGREEVLTIDVRLETIGMEQQKTETILTLPFRAVCGTKWFRGKTEADAVDVQRWTGPKRRSACADYTLTGTDIAGAPCTIRIRNTDSGDGWKPHIETDSAALAFLNGDACTAIVEQRGLKGPIVRIYAQIP